MNIVFMGTPQAAVPSLKKIVADGHEVIEVWTQPDRPSGRGRHLSPPPVKTCAESLGISVYQPETIRKGEHRERFAGLKADVAVVVAYGKILTKSYLEAFSKGAINVHFSLLPKYRGAAPVNWAIVKGEEVTGVTTMKMNEGMDTGDILLTNPVNIKEDENAIELMERLSHVGAGLLSETLRDYENIVPEVQDESAATYAPMLKKEDGKIDWSLGSGEIVNRIRGFQPFPKSFSFVKGLQITFWSARSHDTGVNGDPGEVIRADDGELVIACGRSTAIVVKELQAAGRSRMNARDFLNSGLLTKGNRFGDQE